MVPNMAEESDEYIKERILQRYENVFGGKIHIAVIDDFPSGGRSYEIWHDEIVERIDKIRLVEGISAEKAGEGIADPYMREHYVTFESFMAAYWKRKQERSNEKFMRAISARDIDAAVKAYKQLSKFSQDKLVPR